MTQWRETELHIPARGTYIPATLALPEAREPAPLVAFAHGFSGSRQEGGGYRRMAAALCENGVASIRMDFPGCGDSVESFRLCTLSNMVSDVRACVSYALMRYPLDGTRLGVTGMSFGGRVAMELINGGAPAFSAAVLIAPAADNATIRCVAGEGDAWERARCLAGEQGYAPVPCYFGGPDLELSREWFSDLTRMDTLGGARTGRCIMRVIYAEDDATVPPAVSRRVAEAYGAELVEIGGDGHSYGCYSERSDILARVTDCVTAFYTEKLTAHAGA